MAEYGFYRNSLQGGSYGQGRQSRVSNQRRQHSVPYLEAPSRGLEPFAGRGGYNINAQMLGGFRQKNNAQAAERLRDSPHRAANARTDAGLDTITDWREAERVVESLKVEGDDGLNSQLSIQEGRSQANRLYRSVYEKASEEGVSVSDMPDYLRNAYAEAVGQGTGDEVFDGSMFGQFGRLVDNAESRAIEQNALDASYELKMSTVDSVRQAFATGDITPETISEAASVLNRVTTEYNTDGEASLALYGDLADIAGQSQENADKFITLLRSDPNLPADKRTHFENLASTARNQTSTLEGEKFLADTTQQIAGMYDKNDNIVDVESAVALVVSLQEQAVSQRGLSKSGLNAVNTEATKLYVEAQKQVNHRQNIAEGIKSGHIDYNGDMQGYGKQLSFMVETAINAGDGKFVAEVISAHQRVGYELPKEMHDMMAQGVRSADPQIAQAYASMWAVADPYNNYPLNDIFANTLVAYSRAGGDPAELDPAMLNKAVMDNSKWLSSDDDEVIEQRDDLARKVANDIAGKWGNTRFVPFGLLDFNSNLTPQAKDLILTQASMLNAVWQMKHGTDAPVSVIAEAVAPYLTSDGKLVTTGMPKTPDPVTGVSQHSTLPNGKIVDEETKYFGKAVGERFRDVGDVRVYNSDGVGYLQDESGNNLTLVVDSNVKLRGSDGKDVDIPVSDNAEEMAKTLSDRLGSMADNVVLIPQYTPIGEVGSYVVAVRPVADRRPHFQRDEQSVEDTIAARATMDNYGQADIPPHPYNRTKPQDNAPVGEYEGQDIPQHIFVGADVVQPEGTGVLQDERSESENPFKHPYTPISKPVTYLPLVHEAIKQGLLPPSSHNQEDATAENLFRAMQSYGQGTPKAHYAYYTGFLDFIKGNEGVRLQVYKDTKGIKTIGVGVNMGVHKDLIKRTLSMSDGEYNKLLSGTQRLTSTQSNRLVRVINDEEKIPLMRNRLGDVYDMLMPSERMAINSMVWQSPEYLGKGMVAAVKSFVKDNDPYPVLWEILHNTSGKLYTGRRKDEAAMFVGYDRAFSNLIGRYTISEEALRRYSTQYKRKLDRDGKRLSGTE